MAEENTTMYQGMYRGDAENGFGIGGVDGIHHKNALGWDNTTVGPASSVFNRVLAQNGVRSNDPNVIPALEPIRAGRFIGKWLKVPPFFNNVAINYLKFFLEDCVRGVDGIPDNQIGTITGTPFGAVQQEFDYPGYYKESGKTFTLTTMTSTGDGLGKLVRYWQYALSDPVTGVGHLYGKNIRYVRPNYSGSFIYIFLGPDARPGSIEFSCLWHEAWPTSPDGYGIFTSGMLGDPGNISERTVEFSGMYQTGPEVNILAKYITAAYSLYGQSYFDQMLPAYMYEQFLGKIQASDPEILESLTVAQSGKLKGMRTSTLEEVYNDNTITTRNDMRQSYGLDSENVPSKKMPVDKTIEQVNQYNTEKFDDVT